jgi:predicted ATPase
MKPPVLQSFRLRNFKAVRDSKAVRLTPLTVFIGNNGSGKGSLGNYVLNFNTCG